MLLSGVSTAWADWNPTYTVSSYTYDGTEKKFNLSITNNGGCSNAAGEVSSINEGNDGTSYLKFDPSYTSEKVGTNAKTYTVYLKNNCSGHQATLTINWTISPYNISGDKISVNSPSATYTGSPINVDFTVSFTKGNSEVVTLTKGTDYTVSPTTVTTVGTHTITITGKGNFTGSITKNFQVISAAENWTVSSYTASTVYNGSVQYAKDVINITGSNCGYIGYVKDRDNLSVINGQQSATNVGSYTAEVKNTCSSHPGTYTFSWEIQPYNVSGNDFTVTLANQNWTGNAINVSPTVKFNSATLTSGTDYTFYTTPSVVKDPGEYTLVVVGKGNFTGNKSLKFNVYKNIGDASIKYEIPLQLKTTTDGTNYTMPANFSMVVKDGTKLLNTTEDYTLEFSTDGGSTYYAWNNASLSSDAGKYKVKVTGTGNYSNNKVLDFYIANEYQTFASDIYHITSPGYPTTDSPTGAVIKGEMQLGAKTSSAISVDSKNKTIPATQTLNITDDITFNIVGIENGAFAGCNILSWIDATALTNYTPSGLDRTAGAASPFAGVPKQSLVFLYGSTITGENYVYKLGAGTDYRCEVFKIYDDTNGNQKGFDGTDYSWAYENPYAFTANTVINTRVLSAGQHYTTCLPYPLQLPSSIKAYTLEASSATLLGFKEVTGTSGTTLAAFTPYVIIPSSSGSLLSTENITIPATTGIANFQQVGATTATTGGSHQLVGSLRYMTNGAAGCYIMQSGNIWKQFTGTGTHPNACILPMRAYVISSGYPSAARPRLSAVFNDSNGNTTVIDDLRLNPEDSDCSDNSELFDLQGRRVTSPPSPGIYIRNGKKTLHPSRRR